MEKLKHNFTLYDIALNLKELGFDEPCFGVYYISDEEREVVTTIPPYIYDNVLGIYKKYNILAPLYQQAFDFFREKYGLFHSITEYNKDGSLIIEISKDRVEIFRKMTNFDFTEYRKAEIECLKKLIEIVKDNYVS